LLERLKLETPHKARAGSREEKRIQILKLPEGNKPEVWKPRRVASLLF
jgi:hypothetical protein